jgi:very-short-patch-repair endonuclease
MIINHSKRKYIRRALRKKQTPQETVLWSKIRNNALGFKFRRQVSIGPYIADFYCRECLVVVEIDGSQHLENKEYDAKRDKYFSGIGITTLRFWNKDINTNLDTVLQQIFEILQTTSPRSDRSRSRPSPAKERAEFTVIE